MKNHELESLQRQIADDEIDLIQLFLILIKRKYLILCIFLLCLVVGGSFAFLRPLSYEYLTVIEIGTTIKNMEIGDIEEIESPKAVLEKVKAAYVPLNSQDQNNQKIGVTANSPKESQLIILKSSGSQKSEIEYRDVHTKIAGAVIDDHQGKLQSVQRQLLSQIDRLKSDLDKIMSTDLIQIKTKTLQGNINQKKRNLLALNDDEQAYLLRSSYELNRLDSKLLAIFDNQKLKIIHLKNKTSKGRATLDNLKGKKNNLEKKKELLTQEKNLLVAQIEEISNALAEIRKERLAAPSEVDNPAGALTLMIVENQLGQYRTRRESLDFRIEVDLKQKSNNFDMQMADINRQILTQEDVLGALAVEFEILGKVHLREVTQAENEINHFKAKRIELQGSYKRQNEEKKNEIVGTTNKLNEYQITHAFVIAKQKQKITESEAKLSSLQATRILGVAVRSANPTGTGKSLILALAGMLGLMGGIMLAFLAEFMIKVRQQQAKEDC